MRYRRVLLDIDETLADMTNIWLDELNKVSNRQFTKQDCRSYNMTDIYSDMTFGQILEVAKRTQILERATPFPGVRQTLECLDKLNVEVTLFTARGWHPDADRLTRRWLIEHQLPYAKLCVIPIHDSKARYAKQHLGRKFDWFVDDHLKHIQSFRQTLPGVKTLLMTQPWNEHDTRESRIQCLPDLLHRIR